MDFERFYKEGGYLAANPEWDESDSEWKGTMIADLLKKNAIQFNSLTEVGCGAGGIVAFLAEKFAGKEITGYDISPQAIAIASKKAAASQHLHFYNADYLNEPGNNTDVLLMADVLEHVPDYYAFLNKLRGKSCQFVFHIPLDVSCRTVLKPHILMQQRKDVGHIHYFTEEYVWWMLADCGYKVKDWHYTKPLIDFKPPGSVKQAIKKILRAVSYSISEKWSVRLWGGYSLLILAECYE